MSLTYNWIQSQIKDYKKMISELDMNDGDDLRIHTIWATTLNTLESVKRALSEEIYLSNAAK